jgi:hypothetical protein
MLQDVLKKFTPTLEFCSMQKSSLDDSTLRRMCFIVEWHLVGFTLCFTPLFFLLKPERLVTKYLKEHIHKYVHKLIFNSHVINYYCIYFMEAKWFVFLKNNFLRNDGRTGYLQDVIVLGQKLVLGKPLNYISCWWCGFESASSPLVGFGELNDNIIKGLISLLSVEQEIEFIAYTCGLYNDKHI